MGEGTVLVVDVEPLSVEFVERRLKDAGFDTVSASRVDEGVAAAFAADPPFDVVLVAHQLPDGTGLDLVRRLRENPRTSAISIALLTSMPDPEETTRILAAGADEVLRKPIHRVELVARVRSLHRIKRQFDELRRTNARLVELNAALEQTATTDGLTRLVNRRYLDERLIEEVLRAQRYGSPLSVLMIDVDHFKKVNDVHGHAAGDAVLRAVAATIKASVRIIDIPARYGGEELVVVAPSTSWTGARVLAERLRGAIEALETMSAGMEQPIRVTASIGCAALGAEQDGHSLLEAADQALYEAKHGGRNRVVMSGAPPEGPLTGVHSAVDVRTTEASK